MKHSSESSMGLRAYHDQEHLLFQFLVMELILAHVQVLEVEKNVFILNEVLDLAVLEEIKAPLLFLCGSGQNHMRLFKWGEDGILSKLRNYCIFFAEKNSSDLKKVQLYQEADRLWLSTLYALDLIQMNSKQMLVPTIDIGCFRLVISKIRKGFKKVANHVKSIFMQFRHNENVLLFILRYREQLDRIYGERFVFILMRKMFSRSLEKAQFFIEEKYRARGFYHILPLVQHHISILK